MSGKRTFDFKGRVLVTDDDPVNRRALEALLGRLGLVVATAVDGGEALRELRALPYDLGFLDLNMPVKNGMQVAREIRLLEEAEAGGRLPLIAVSGEPEQRLWGQCRTAGIDGYLQKPFTLDMLLEILKKWLPGEGGEESPAGTGGAAGPAVDERSSGQTGAATVHPGTATGSPSVTLDGDRLRMLDSLEEGTSPGFLPELAGVYVKTSTGLVRRLRRSFDAGDGEDVALAAHELKSGSLNMGGLRLAELCGDLELLCLRGPLAEAAGLVAEIVAEQERVHAALDMELRRMGKGGKEH